MRIEDRSADNGVTLDKILTGYTYRSTVTGDIYLAGRDSVAGVRVVTNLSTGAVYYGVDSDVRFIKVDAHVVLTAM